MNSAPDIQGTAHNFPSKYKKRTQFRFKSGLCCVVCGQPLASYESCEPLSSSVSGELLSSSVSGADPSFSLLLSRLESSDTKVYAPKIRALLGTASHFCEVASLEERSPSSLSLERPVGACVNRRALGLA